ncbi:hypothetical protein GCK72_002889 [Caenorhabditis remanei]|uniref:Zinc finger RING-type eukaryotic domain-containing protein n=1 Tax=Caenorhabditis remanei TaxID=31234 RepID=A0A6A5HWA2_CAERE|nr:hypothetical protein GCK72_002889 [Caenorhabditis remanei]KAF1771064.1 hypothetical protein GCK72_002889 [Caenorhabditis remanei]
MARLNMSERQLREQSEALRLEKKQLQNELTQARRDLNQSLRNQAEAQVIHEDDVNELREVRAALAAIRVVVGGYGGGRGIHAAMAGVQCTVCLQEFTGPKGNRVPKLLPCGHTFSERSRVSRRGTGFGARVSTENAATAIHNNFILFNNQ